MKEVRVQLKPFQGLDYTLDLDSSKGLIDEDILKAAFGITMSRGGSTDGLSRDGKDMVKVQVPRTPGIADDVFEMEVPLQLLKGRTPELEVSVPLQRPAPNRSPHYGSRSPVPQSAVSVLSPPATGGPAAQVSVVSPLETVQSPTPVRPFSTASLEGMTKTGAGKKQVTPAMKSANSMSSAGTSEQDGKSSGCSHESPRSSLSSIDSVTGLQKSGMEHHSEIVEATSLRLDTTSLYHAALATRPSRAGSPLQMRTASPYQSTLQHPMIHRAGSSTSLRSTMSTANVNKPLPPEPKRLSTISSNPSESSSLSRSSSATVRQSTYPQRSGQILPGSSVRAIEVTRYDSARSSSSAASLRSKYTPKDLDALDDAFLQRNPPNQSRVPKVKSPTEPFTLYSSSFHSSPNPSNVSLVNDKSLGIICEEPVRDYRQNSASSDVIQISRGPMRMQPTRRAPQPPKTPTCRPGSSIPHQSSPHAEPPRLAKRSQSSTHIGSQYRETLDAAPPQRSTTLMVGSSSKADRILGKSSVSGPSASRPDININTGWIRNGSAQQLQSEGNSTASSRLSSRDETHSPEIERSPADAHFDEIRKRLELLSPKDDPSATFQAFYHRNARCSSGALRPEHANSITRDPPSRALKSSEPQREAPQPPTDEPQQHIEAEIRPEPQAFIAELEAPHFQQVPEPWPEPPEPVELQGSEIPTLVELGHASPKPLTRLSQVPIPPEPPMNEEAPGIVSKRGRINSSNPQSTLSAKSRSFHSQGSVRVRSLASLAASEIRDIYAALPSQNSSQRPSLSAEEVEMMVSAETAGRVRLRILEHLDSLGDLFAAARVSRGFYRTFKRHELHLLKLVLNRTSAAAWELREMSIPFSELADGAKDYTPDLYFRHYVRDMMTMIELKALILDNCKGFLRQDTISGLAGETDRSQGMDEAFWRVWTFCRIFGCGNNREDDIVGQMDWLRGGVLAKQSTGTITLALTDELAKNSVLFKPPHGFAEGNGSDGLSAEELYDMFELWTCLGVLIQGYQGERAKARRYGVFDNTNIIEGDVEKENALIEEWTYHLLANAPSTIIDVASFSDPTEEIFSRAQSQGHTKWSSPSSGGSRSTFLKEAVSRVYEEKIALQRPPPSASPRSFSNLPQVVTPPSNSAALPDRIDSRARVAAHAAKIRARKQEPSYKTIPLSPERPMSDFNNVLNRLEALSTSDGNNADALPVPRMPSIATRFPRRRPKVKVPENTRSETASPSESVNSSPISNRQNIGGNIGDRIATLRERVTGRNAAASSSKPTILISSPLQQSLENIPTAQAAAIQVPQGPQVRDPVDIAVDKMVEMGFDEASAKKALANTDNGGRIDVEKAIRILTKQKKRAERLERLDRMG